MNIESPVKTGLYFLEEEEELNTEFVETQYLASLKTFTRINAN